MTEALISYAQNGEDVVLWRALGRIENGTYLDIGANHPQVDSVTRMFYDAGWCGLAVEPNPVFAQLFREQRPRDVVFEAVVSNSPESTATLHVVGDTGLSTLVDAFGDEYSSEGMNVSDITVSTISLNEAIAKAGFDDGRELHFLSVDTEGAEALVLASIDFTRYRPWVLIIEATAPRSTTKTHAAWETLVTSAGYTYCFFDGLSRYYAADEHLGELAEPLSYGACVLDNYVTKEHNDLTHALWGANVEADRLRAENAKLSEQLDDDTLVIADLRKHVGELHRTLSWRVTAPLRAVRARTRH